MYTAPKVDRPLTTGLHTVSDLYCSECDTEVGWYYNHAYEQSQKYKEHKFILVENKIKQDDQADHTAHPTHSTHTNTTAQPQQHDPAHAAQPHTPLHHAGSDEDEEDDEDDDDDGEEEGRGPSLGFAHAALGGHALSPATWTELTAVMGPSAAALSAEVSRRRVMVPAEMRVRMRTRAAHAAHGHH